MFLLCKYSRMPQPFSPIQNSIISRLKNAKTLRYSQLHPGDKTPNDLFNYHLQFLVKKGFVAKRGEGYALSELGVRHVADFIPFEQSQRVVSLFKMNVITIVSRIHQGRLQILNQLRKSNPSYGKIGVMGGVVLKGESASEAATRKLLEETGLIASFTLLGIERRVMYVKDELFSDVLFPIAYARESSGELRKDTEYGENRWVDIDEAIKNESDPFDSITAIKTVLHAIKDGAVDGLPFFYSEQVKRGTERP
jgi:ADP-ribose pyrophosphatase YjhB (NUDIX family)